MTAKRTKAPPPAADQGALFDSDLMPNIMLVTPAVQIAAMERLGQQVPGSSPRKPRTGGPRPKKGVDTAIDTTDVILAPQDQAPRVPPRAELAERDATDDELGALRDEIRTVLTATIGPPNQDSGCWRMDDRERQVRELRNNIANDARRQFGAAFPKVKLEPGLVRDLERGWLLPHLEYADSLYTGRWAYYFRLLEDGKLTPEQGPIPFMHFCDQPDAQTMKMLHNTMDGIPLGSGWRECWSSHVHFEYFLDWVLYGLGHPLAKERPKEPYGCEGAEVRLYQLFQMPAMLLWPFDYLGHMMAEAGFGKHQAFYPTPHTISELIARMTFNPLKDQRALTVMDPCMGTGRLTLHASNYSLQLFGMDINLLCVKATIINLALYAPWGYLPLKFLHDQKAAESETDA